MTPLAYVVAIAIAATAILITLAVVRALQSPVRRAAFDEGLAAIASSEFAMDVAANPTETPKRGFFDYWWRETLQTGMQVTDPSTPGKTAIMAMLAGAAATGLATGNPLFAVAGLPLGALIYRTYLRVLQRKRTTTMERQLPDLLMALRANLQAGATEVGALLAVADDLAAPLGDEIRRLRDDLNVSMPLSDALAAMAQRVPSREMQFLASSIEIAHRSGADLHPQLITIEDIVAQRIRIRQKLGSAIAQVRPTEIIAGLAVPAMFFLSFNDPQNREFWLSGLGMIAGVLCAVCYAAMLYTIHAMIKNVENT